MSINYPRASKGEPVAVDTRMRYSWETAGGFPLYDAHGNVLECVFYNPAVLPPAGPKRAVFLKRAFRDKAARYKAGLTGAGFDADEVSTGAYMRNSRRVQMQLALAQDMPAGDAGGGRRGK